MGITIKGSVVRCTCDMPIEEDEYRIIAVGSCVCKVYDDKLKETHKIDSNSASLTVKQVVPTSILEEVVESMEGGEGGPLSSIIHDEITNTVREPIGIGLNSSLKE